MSTDLPENAIDLARKLADAATEDRLSINPDHGSALDPLGDCMEWWERIAARVLGNPVPAPEPPSLAERMALWDERIGNYRPAENLDDRYQAMVHDLGLVCRDEVPTVTQVMEALGFELIHEDDDPEGEDDCWSVADPLGARGWVSVDRAQRLTAIGVRPDQQVP